MSRIEQRYIVQLGERDGKQIWLAYDACGRIGNSNYAMAFRFDTSWHARMALQRERMTGSRWINAKILGTTVDVEVME